MDARIFFHLTDAIASATSAVDLSATEDLIRATRMHVLERRALTRAVRIREAALRAGADVAVPTPARAPRGD